MPVRRISEIAQEPSANLLRIVFSEKKASARGPAIFIDRDGVINQRRPDDYVLNWSQFVFVPGIREALKQLSTLGLPMIVISNQAAVGKGLLTLDGLREITTRMQQALLEDGTALTAAYYCPHRSEENCACRKPRPGLLHMAANDLNVNLSRSVLVGDSETDIKAAEAAGSRSILLVSNSRNLGSSVGVTSTPVVYSTAEVFDAAEKLLSQ